MRAGRFRNTVLVGALCVGVAVLTAYAVRAGDVSVSTENLSADDVAEVNRTVVAEVRPIESVLVLDAVVVANPVFRVAAPYDGALVRMRDGGFGVSPGGGARSKPLRLPARSRVISLLVSEGTWVKEGEPVADAQYAGFALQATVAPEKLYRLYEGVASARGEISNGPGPFAGALLGVPFPPGSGVQMPVVVEAPSEVATPAIRESASGGKDMPVADEAPSEVATDTSSEQSPMPYVVSADRAGVIVVSTVPKELRLIEGLPGLLALTTSVSTTSVALPVEAVAGIAQRGQVYVEHGGTVTVRDVTLGITDGTFVAITSGLAVGERVRIPSPSIANLR